MSFVMPVRLSEDELDFARLMSEPPMSYAEAVAFRAKVASDEDE